MDWALDVRLFKGQLWVIQGIVWVWEGICSYFVMVVKLE